MRASTGYLFLALRAATYVGWTDTRSHTVRQDTGDFVRRVAVDMVRRFLETHNPI
jgi:hypothetical protein